MAAYAPVKYTGNGSTQSYAVPFPYIDRKHVKAYLNGVATAAFTWTNASTIQFTVAPGAGVAIEIRRETPSEEPQVIFTGGSSIKPQALDKNTKALLYFSQEEKYNTQGVARSLQFPTGDSTDPTLPAVNSRAARILGFDSDGKPAMINPAVQLIAADFICENIATLRTITGAVGRAVQVLGYYTAADGGGGPVRVWSSAPLVDNGGSVIVPNSGPVGAWIFREWSGNARHWGAKGDGVDDTARIQALLTQVATQQWGDIHFPCGDYRVRYTRTDGNCLVLAMGAGSYYGNPTNKPIRITGEGARLITDPDTASGAILLNIAHARGITINGIDFIGTRTPSDTDIEATQGNTLLYFTWCQDVEVYGNKFLNCNGAGIYFFVRNFLVHDNIFRNANGGCQGNLSSDVQIYNNQFLCEFKCDDQIGVFTSSEFTDQPEKWSRKIFVYNNIVDKYYDGTKGVGGTKRGWARCIVMSGKIVGIDISDNILLNNNSTNASDRTPAGALLAIRFEGQSALKVSIRGNKIHNCRRGIQFDAIPTDLTITGNDFQDIENYCILGSSGHLVSKIFCESNRFVNCGTDGATDIAVRFSEIVRAVIRSNTMMDMTGLRSFHLSNGGATLIDALIIEGNSEISTHDNTGNASSNYLQVERANQLSILNNKVRKRCTNGAYVVNRGDMTEISANTFLGHAANALDVQYVYPGKAGVVYTAGNYEVANGGAFAGRNKMLKMMLGLGSLSNGVYERYLCGPAYGKGIMVGAAGERDTVAGLNYRVGDERRDTAPAAGGWIGEVCTSSGAPGTWKNFGAIQA